MTFYKISFVSRVDGQGRPVVEPVNGKAAVKELSIRDTRTLEAIRAAYDADESITVERLGTSHAPGRPLEKRDKLIVFKPHLISLDKRAAFAQAGGPLPFEHRER